MNLFSPQDSGAGIACGRTTSSGRKRSRYSRAKGSRMSAAERRKRARAADRKKTEEEEDQKMAAD